MVSTTLSFMLSLRATNMTVDLTTVKYFDKNDRSLTSIHRHPMIRTMLVSLNADLTSSTSVERIFSLAGVTLTT